MILAGSVTVNGVVVDRPSLEVRDEDVLLVAPDADPYVSRGARKIAGALARFEPQGLSVRGRMCLDAGASTGGFTQMLLERGAAGVLAVDVGHGQLAASVSGDPRVTSREGVNVRDLPPPGPGAAVQLLVADLSFISLELVVPALAAWLEPGGDALLLVKPQFEVGAARLGKGGVVRDLAARAEAVAKVARAMEGSGLSVCGVARSPLSGADGNVEIFIWGRKTWQAGDGAHGPSAAPPALDSAAISRAIDREVKGAP